MKKMLSFLVMGIFVLSLFFAFPNLGYSADNATPGVWNWYDICVFQAQEKRNSTIRHSCETFPVNLFNWTKAYCISEANRLYRSEVMECATTYGDGEDN